MKIILKIIWFIAAVISISACDDFQALDGKGKFYYTNPSTDTMTFKLDGKGYDILPDEKGVILISSGLHHLEDEKGHITDFFVFENNSGGIINPNQFVYYTLSEVYAVDGKENRFQPASYPVTINGHELEMPIRSSNATIIDANIFRCSYPVGEAFPESITLYDDNLDGNIKSKCFDKLELIQYIKNEYNKNLLPQKNHHGFLDSVNIDFMYVEPTADFANANVQLKAEKLVKLVRKLKDSDDADIHKKLNEEFYQATTELVHEYAQSSASNTVSENVKYNEFIQQINLLRENGIWVR
ncbi:hypothetical protein AB7Z57_19885 [Providencia alcalifaciens]